MKDDYDDLDRILAGLDEPFGDGPSENFNTKDRNPVMTAVKSAGKSAFGRLFPRGRRDEVILKALPDSYSRANDEFREIKYAAKDLYSHTKEELVATERTLQRKAGMLAPRIRKFLPGKLGEKFDRWAEDDSSGYNWGSEDTREASINSQLDSAFRPQEQMVANPPPKKSKAQLDAESNEEATEKASDEIRRYTSDLRQQRMDESLANIQHYVERITSGQTAVLGWRRKSLEVGLRQLFAMTDLVNLVKYNSDRVIPAVEAIVKNTALPDYAKETSGEIAMAMAKRRLVESLSPAEYARTFVQDFAKKTKERISNLGNEVRGAMDFFDMMQDDGMGEELTEEQQRQKYLEQGGSIVGDLLARKYAMPVRDKFLAGIKKQAEKSDRVKEMGERLRYYTGNVSSIYNTELTDETDDSFFKTLVSYMSDIKSGYDGEHVALGQRGEDWLNSPMVQDNRLYVTQTEIIPAYLRSIDSAVWKLNGEDRDNVYDVTTRSFVSSTDFARQIRKQVGQSQKKEIYDRGLNKLVKDFDAEDRLSDQGKAELKKYFDDRIKKNLTFDIKSLSSIDNLTEIMSDFDDTLAFEERIEELADENLYQNMNKFADNFKRLRALAGNYQDEVNRVALIHGEKSLVDAGVFNRNRYGLLDVDRDLTDPNVRFEDKVQSSARRAADSVRNFASANQPQPTLPSSFTVNTDTTTLENKLDNVSDSIDAISPLNKLDTIIQQQKEGYATLQDVVKVIQELKDKGIQVQSTTESQTNSEGTDKETWFSGAKRRARSIATYASQLLQGGWKGLGKLATRLKAGAKDIYDEHGNKILSGAKLKAGEYWTKVNGKLKRIFTIDEIEGALYDKDGVEILSEEELEKAGKLRFFKEGRWHKVSDYLKTKIVSGASAVMGFSGRRFTDIRNISQMAKGYVFDLPDIYLAGESTPRLRAVLIKKGHYFCNGNVISKLSDITGEVKDKDGRTIISEEEFNSPEFKLVDQDGNDVKNRLGKLRARIAKNLSDTKAATGRVAKWAKEKSLAGYAKVKGFFNRGENEDGEKEEREGIFARLFGKVEEKGKRAREYDVLIKIYNLLNRRLPGEPGEDLPENERVFSTDNIKSALNKGKENVAKKYKAAKESRFVESVQEKFEKGKAKAEETVETVKSKADEMYKETASKRRYARMRGNKVKRNVIDQAKRNRRAAELKAKRVRRDFSRARDNDEGVIRASATTAKKHFKPAFENALTRRIKKMGSFAADKLRVPLDAPAEKFGRSGIKVAKNDPQVELLKRIADSSEGNWIRGLSQDAQSMGVNPSFRSQMLINFSKRFKGNVSRLYRQMASNNAEEKEKSLLGKVKDKFTAKKGKEDKDKSGIIGTLTSILGTAGEVLNTGIQSILGSIASKLGIGAATSVGGSLLGNVVKGGAKAAWKVGGWLGKGLLMGGRAAAAAVGVGAGAGGTALAVAGSILGTAASIITSPITLGIAAVAGLGYLAYKHATRKTPSIPGRVRFAQYGTRSYNNWSEDDAIKMVYLEGELQRYLKKTPTGMVIQGLDKEKAAELAIGYGVEQDNEVELTAFLSWLMHRFIPIYLLWHTRMQEYAISGTVQDIETNKLDYETQKKLVNGIRLASNHPIFVDRVDPSKADRGIFMRMSDWVGITDRDMMNGEEVADVTARALTELDDLIARNKKKQEQEKRNAAGKASFNEGMKAQDEKRAKQDVTNTPRAQSAYEAMYGGRKDKGPQHVGALQPTTSTDSMKVSVSPVMPVETKPMYDVEKGRFALYGLEQLDQESTLAVREIERLMKAHVDNRTKQVELEFFDKALPHVTKLGDMAKAEYGENHDTLMKSWLRERVVPMYIAYCETMNKLVGGGAVMTPQINEEVYRALVSLVEAKSQMASGHVDIIKLPQGVAMVGDFLLMKDASAISRILSTIKPAKKVRIREEDNKPKNTTVKPQEKKTQTPLQKRQQELAALKASLKPTVDKIAQERSSGGLNVRDVKVDKDNLGSGEYSQFAGIKLRSREDIALLIGKIAEAQGVDPDLLITTAMVESSLDPNARPPKGSAAGLFQFVKKTWNEQMQKHGNRLGIPQGTAPTDPIAATLLAAEYFRSNAKALPGDKHSVVDLYMTHFLGGGGASKFQRGMRKNPNAYAVEDFRSEAANNQSVFYHSNGRPKTYAEIYKSYTDKFVARSSQVRSLTGGMYGGSVFSEASDAALARDANRARVIENKAKLEVAASRNNNEAYTSVSPTGVKMPIGTLAPTAETPVSEKADEFRRNTPGANESDVAQYERALTEAYSKPTAADTSRQQSTFNLDRLISSNKSNHEETLKVLSDQLVVQNGMLTVLRRMDKKLGVLSEGKGDLREARQDAIQEMREDKALPKLPIDLSVKQVNVGRNKNI